MASRLCCSRCVCNAPASDATLYGDARKTSIRGRTPHAAAQNAIGVVKMWALVAGLLGLKHANEWVVTTKMGSGRKKGHHQVAMEIPTRRMYVPELAYGCFMMLATSVGVVNRLHFGINVYMLFQGMWPGAKKHATPGLRTCMASGHRVRATLCNQQWHPQAWPF